METPYLHLPDLLEPGLRLVISGTTIGRHSAIKQQYYAGRRNKFWQILHTIGLTPFLLSPSDYEYLLDYGIGLTDLVKTKAGIDFNICEFTKKIRIHQPEYLCFNGRRAAVEYLSRPVDFGLQSETINKTKIFIGPSTSAAASGNWNERIWFQLSEVVCKQVTIVV